MCKVDGCSRDSDYYKQDVCQKHYFRFMRNGTYDKIRKRKNFSAMTPNGYLRVYYPEHDLSTKDGFVFEHRAIFYDDNKLEDLCCDFCGVDWSFRPYYDHVDHIDENKLNNDLPNLRPLCNSCNTGRTKITQHKLKNNISITWFGETKTPQEWGRDERIPVSGWCIRQRLSRDYSIEDALFSKKKTHNST